MIDPTFSRARDAIWRVWAAPGPTGRPLGLPFEPSAARARPLTDATSIGEHPITRPRAASPRPETDDLMGSTI